MENNRKSLLDNLGQEAQSFLEEGRQPTKPKEKEKKLDSPETPLDQVAITVRIPRKLYESLTDASFYAKRKRIREFDTQQAIIVDALTGWLKGKGYLS